jgi:hypothetical protein
LFPEAEEQRHDIAKGFMLAYRVAEKKSNPEGQNLF